MNYQVSKTVLDNGLAILVLPRKRVPKVSIQLWYGVGSKDEKDGERGLAHLLEHMIFKGTDILSESDINRITHKLSGSCNAFTSYDYTAYVFDFPKQNWQASLPLLANCMRNCTFKEDLLNAELKAVIQELKMYNDDYLVSLNEMLTSSIFARQPYHFPIIGFKQDLWNITRDRLLDFYYHHYVPNNATLVIVGDVSVPFAMKEAQKAFGHLTRSDSYIKRKEEISLDIGSKALTLYRDIQQPILMYGWVVPGVKEKNAYYAELIGWILGQGKGSMIYQELVTNQLLAAHVESSVCHMYEKSLLLLIIEPFDGESIAKIKQIVFNQIRQLSTEQIDEQKVIRAYKQYYIDYLELFEDNEKVAYEIGKLYQATGNENALTDIPVLNAELPAALHEFSLNYVRPSLMHEAACLPISQKELSNWQKLQEQADQYDEKILSKKIRTTDVECGIYVEQFSTQETSPFIFPVPHKTILENGLTVIWHDVSDIPKIDLILKLKANHYYDHYDKQGLYNFMCHMMLEGTKNYPGNELILYAESKGITVSFKSGNLVMSMLKEDLQAALEILLQLLCKADFTAANVEKIRNQLLAELAMHWDNPFQFADDIIKSEIYKNHPYEKNLLGTKESLETITLQDLKNAYESLVSAADATLVIVGDLYGYQVPELVKEKLFSWKSEAVPDLIYPPINPVTKKIITHCINRDQTVLSFAGLSVVQQDERYNYLLLFDQIFTGGVLGSMSSLLFQLREKTGLFYTISGSTIAYAAEQPGIIDIRTIVSNERLNEAIELIEDIIAKAPNLIKQEDIDHAKNAVINSLVDNFQTNEKMAATFLFLERFKLPVNYFDTKIKVIKNITAEQIQAVVIELLNNQKMIQIKIGRV